LGCPESSCRFLVGGVRTGLNISERLKTNDLRIYLRIYIKDGTSGILGKKFGCDTFNFCQFYTPLSMEENKVHFRHLMLFFYQKGKNATQAANKICAVYGEGAVAERTVRKWFARFKVDDFNLEDQECPDRPLHHR